MRISDRYDRFTDRVTSTKTNAAKGTDTSAARSTTASTTTPAQDGILSVSVSAQAKDLAAGTARLEQLRDQVRNGTFKIDAKDIANKLVGEDA